LREWERDGFSRTRLGVVICRDGTLGGLSAWLNRLATVGFEAIDDTTDIDSVSEQSDNERY
jgi:hypothetical protein